MEYFLISLSAFLSSLVGLFSGFGLNSVMVPVFAFFFPLNIAIAYTAIVHFIHNLLKFFLFGKHADKSVVIKFGLPAIFAALFGVWTLKFLSHLSPVFNYTLFHHEFFITPIKLVISILIMSFALLDLLPNLKHISFDRKVLPVGGLLSGFIGGLSGHQGGIRSAFLIKCNLSKESFIGTGVVIALMVDLTRIILYMSLFSSVLLNKDNSFLVFAIFAAFAGVITGTYLLKKVSLGSIQTIIGVMLLIFSVGLALGII